jgi:hypothetical protein
MDCVQAASRQLLPISAVAVVKTVQPTDWQAGTALSVRGGTG